MPQVFEKKLIAEDCTYNVCGYVEVLPAARRDAYAFTSTSHGHVRLVNPAFRVEINEVKFGGEFGEVREYREITVLCTSYMEALDIAADYARENLRLDWEEVPCQLKWSDHELD